MGTSLDSAGRVRAAGVVPWRLAAAAPGADAAPGYGGGIELGLVHRPRYDDWSWPKGKIDPGEHDLTTAAREALEETGLAVRLGRPLGSQRYPVDDIPKLVR